MAKAPTNDFTGKQREALLKQQAEEVQKRQEEIYLATQIQNQVNENEVLDVTGDPTVPVVIDDVVDTTVEPEAPAPAPAPAEEVTVLETEDDGTVVIRVAEDLQAVTIGDKTYDFVAGRKYKVEKNVADVLRWAGRLYDRA